MCNLQHTLTQTHKSHRHFNSQFLFLFWIFVCLLNINAVRCTTEWTTSIFDLFFFNYNFVGIFFLLWISLWETMNRSFLNAAILSTDQKILVVFGQYLFLSHFFFLLLLLLSFAVSVLFLTISLFSALIGDFLWVVVAGVCVFFFFSSQSLLKSQSWRLYVNITYRERDFMYETHTYHIIWFPFWVRLNLQW